MATNTSEPQSSPSTRQWPYNSPYYNPMTMRASVLEELSDYLTYQVLSPRQYIIPVSLDVPGTGSALIVSSAIWKFIIVAAILTGITIGVWVFLNKCGVPRFLSWTQTNSSGEKIMAKRPAPPAKILLDLPQLPGNRANDTESEKSIPIANDDRDGVHGEKTNDSTPFVQQKSRDGAKVPERMV